jgi:hypothetical protein
MGRPVCNRKTGSILWGKILNQIVSNTKNIIFRCVNSTTKLSANMVAYHKFLLETANLTFPSIVNDALKYCGMEIYDDAVQYCANLRGSVDGTRFQARGFPMQICIPTSLHKCLDVCQWRRRAWTRPRRASLLPRTRVGRT